MSTKNFDERITTRYGKPEKQIWEKVMEFVEKQRLPKSRAQYLLVERGLQHIGNPKPLVKEVEKIVYQDRPVYVDKPIEKKVYVEKPLDKPFHATKPEPDRPKPKGQIVDIPMKSDQTNEEEQRASVDKLTTPNEVKPDPTSPKLTSGVEKSTKNRKSNGGWIAAGILAAIVGAGIYFSK